ncbi:MAG: hypothetical protein IPL70_08100 [Uliginosibacterium sp.]|nr:hypothetical protein [Uliginosibacterium sp.]
MLADEGIYLASQSTAASCASMAKLVTRPRQSAKASPPTTHIASAWSVEVGHDHLPTKTSDNGFIST